MVQKVKDKQSEWLLKAQEFLQMHPKDVIALRRAAGRPMATAGATALSAFYRLHPDERYEEEEFTVICLMCLWREDEWAKGLSLPKAMKKSLPKDQRQEFPRRLKGLLDLPWEATGYFSSKLYRVIKFCRSKGNIVDAHKLLYALRYWNHPEYFIQRNWVKEFYQMEISEDTSEGEI
ncbi:type I-E CRISPR-associated protein Cse2/CasB [Selenomonas ruminantium]|uniref:CRISPR type I-E/ECOLI-associated protein CasB/Cse2 n=1 Tax=Selenomonas ruminantium TaxID=971 RepID=A0A1K1M4R9_SELRU|nr:type I-E CRISPR-associated protein Cse2/CasB [Selenomonas ruminantium]SFW16950.1 CRISPR type I-E/ECOLI-associated protein CasB/Cse2 [Selenomonas ruminantium]